MSIFQRNLCSIVQKSHLGFQKILLDVRHSVIEIPSCGTKVMPKPRFRHPLWHLKQERAHFPEDLTRENKSFIKQVVADKYGPPAVISGVATYQSPVKDVSEELKPVEWFPKIRRTSTLARKIGIYPLYTKDGKRIMTTLLQIADNHVISYKPPGTFLALRHREKVINQNNLNRYGALIVGAESTDPQFVTKEYCGLFKDSGLPPKKLLTRFLISPEAVIPVGTPLTVMHYRVGDYVDVVGTTIGRGFQGVVRRWGFKGQPATHGSTKTHRRPGNIGGGGEKGRVWPGKKMPGHMGWRLRVTRGLRILRINTEYNVMWVTGQAVAGDINGRVYIHDSLLYNRVVKDAANAPPLPTYIPSKDEVLPEELWAKDMHPYDTPTITFEPEKEQIVVKKGAKTAKIGGKAKGK